jgi:hypothetical protein
MKTIGVLLKRSLSIFIAITILLVVWVQSTPASAAPLGDEYSIANDYIKYIFNARTGGFSIETKDGHPQKSFDNNITLLYKEDRNRSNGTSFITIRIDDKDYIFGQDYGWFGINSKLHEPIVSNEGRLLTIRWDINNYTVIQNVAISLDENNPLCGNVGISFTVTNNSKKDGEVGIRLLLDNALSTNIDAPYVMINQISPTLVETEYTDEIPQQIRYMDSLSSPDKMAYAILDGWSGQNDIMVDKVIVGHWVNLANTRYDYVPDPSCDFSNYSNEHLVPDTATAFYWSEKPIKAGESRVAEMLYGIGNFAHEMQEQRLGISMNAGKVELDSSKKAYKDDGKFSLTVTLDNSVDKARMLLEPIVTITVDEGLKFEATGTREYRIRIEGGLNAGTVYDIPEIAIIADKQAQITSKRIVASVSATEVVDESTHQFVEYSASCNVLLPAAGGILPNIVMNQINPETVYYEGEKSITVSGDMKALSEALAGSDGWSLYLFSSSTKERILIEKKRISFIDDGKTMAFSTTEPLSVGKYNIEFQFSDHQLIASFGNKITASDQLNVSNDPSDRCASYGIVAMVRFDNPSNRRKLYDFVSFANESELEEFISGNKVKDGLEHKGIKFDEDSSEILLIVRGKLYQLTDSEGNSFYQASKEDGDITINNILTYLGDKPLRLMCDKEEGAVAEGDGTLKVINSINVWHNAWQFEGTNGTKFTLDQDEIEDGNGEPFELSLMGAGSMIQYLGGFLIDLKYGVMTEDDGMYGISFGGKITLPIKASDKGGDGGSGSGSGGKGNKDNDDDDDDPDDGEISAAIDDVLFGQHEDGIGFLGINATFSVKLPEDVLGSLVKNAFGVEAELTINTIEHYYRLQFGVELEILECEGSIAFKQVPIFSVPRIVPDELIFYLGGDIMQVPIIPPYLFMTGLGGGISDLADTLSDDTLGELPPLTLHLRTQLLFVETLTGDFELEINLSGLSLTGEFKLKEDDDGKIMVLECGMSARWISPFHINVYGNISICEGLLKGGFTIKIADKYFYGYVYAGLFIPEEIPIVGGLELAGVEAAISTDFIGANIVIIGIKYGFIYYWDGEYKFGEGIDLSSRGAAVTYAPSSYLNDNGNFVESTVAYGTNLRRLTSVPVMKTRAGNGITKYFDPSNEDALLFEVPLKGIARPKAEEIILKSPEGQQIHMVESDGKGGGNYLIQTRNDKNYLYITITDPALLIAGNWTLTITTENVTIDDFEVNGVDDLPILTNVTFSRTTPQSRELKVMWTTDTESDSTAALNVYVTKDSEILNKLEKDNIEEDADSLISIGNIDLDYISSGEHTFTLSETFEEGSYYVIAMLNDHRGGMSKVMSKESFEFINPMLPGKPQSVTLSYAGNGAVKVEVEGNEQSPCNYYMVTLIDEEGQEVPNGFGKYAVDQEIILRPMQPRSNEPALVPGKPYYANVIALKEAITEEKETLYYYSTESTLSEGFVMPETRKPFLISVTTNLPDQGEEIATNNALYEATYTFDMPVKMMFIIDGIRQQVEDEFKTEWSIQRSFEDGIHFVDFEAINEQNDKLTGSEADAVFGFTVDTVAPVLALGQSASTSMGENAEETTVSSQTVFVNEDGSFVINGLTEKSAVLTLDGKKDGITVFPDGTFIIVGEADTSEAVQTLLLRAEDSAGNATELKIHLVNRSFAAFESVKLISELEGSGQQPDYIEMNIGNKTTLKVKGMNAKGEVLLKPEDIVWEILYEQNIIKLSQDGTIEALAPGETAVKVSYRVAVFEGEDGKKIYNELADVIKIRIRDVGFRYELRQTQGFTLLTLFAEKSRGMATVEVEGQQVTLLYDETKKAYMGVFHRRLISEQLIDRIIFDPYKKSPILLRGDTDGNNVVDKVDVLGTINGILSDGYDWSNNREGWMRSDKNGDGVVDISDAQLSLWELLR